jgi:class 3 adenylate cyclase
VLVDRRAAAALEDRFVLEALPPLTLKGFEKPVAAFRLAGARGGA